MPPVNLPPAADRKHWRSLDELADTPEFRAFVEREFPASAERMAEPTSRRSFLRYMAASMALAGVTACRWPREQILPFAHRPEGYTPGEPQHFATAMELGGVAAALLVTSHDGRPIKIEGNPEHPASLGATSAIAQASLLELYDPDRSQRAVRLENGGEVEQGWQRFDAFARDHFGRLREAGGAGLRVLSETSSSPGLAAMRERLLSAFPRARWHEYEPVSRDEPREGTRLVLGRPHRVQPYLDRAEVIVSLDEDFLLQHPDAVRLARDFVAGRSPDAGPMSRLYVLESCYSVTGSMADHRLPLQAKMIPVAAGILGAVLLLEHGLALPPGFEPLGRMLERFQAHPLYTKLDASMARDLMSSRGRSLLLAGSRQPAALHALVAVLNQALGNVGRTLDYTAEPDPDRPTHLQSLGELTGDLSSDKVDTLVILGGNPAFDAPADVDFERAMVRAGTVIRLGAYEDETSRLATWHLPRAHYLEAWGDARDWRGTLSVTQPLIEPLYGGRSAIELVAQLVGEAAPRGYDLVRRTFFESSAGGASEGAWRKALHDGLVAGSAWPRVTPQARGTEWVDRLAPFLRTHVGAEPTAELELVFVQDASVHDGRFANNGWLQELPDPLTKLTWDNAALLGPSTARGLGVWQGDRLRLEQSGRSLELPVYVMPGQAAGSVGVYLGYGRRRSGSVGQGVGQNAYALRASGGLHWTSVEVARARGSHRLATTQDHYAIDPLGKRESDERSQTLAREVELAEYRAHDEDQAHAVHGPHEANLWKQWEYEGRRWGMAIDLNACTGCNACIVACQSENNIPVVGPDEVARGREMHWLRVDRYFSGDPEAPAIAHQPLTCQHCENAPCETVCPVAATVHDSEGLNVMVYNRCVGTRYCLNNCPYKVRRFNYFNNHKHETAIEMMIYNPEVSVRSRGVMEKCTFCVQRIQKAKIKAKNDGREIEDGEFTTACAQVCPTRAIVFGDLGDKRSKVAELHHDARAYALLEWLAVKPRTRYLTRIRNRAPRAGSGTES